MEATGPAAQQPEAASPEPPQMGPFARFFNVFFSPGKVFEDVRRSSRGWWAPILIGALSTAALGSLYVARYDMAIVVREQIKDSSAMKIVSNLMGPEKRDEAVDRAVKQVEVTPAWQMQVSQWVQNFLGWGLIVWFFAFLYGVMAAAMGWLGEARASRLFISLGIIAAIGIGFIAVNAVLQFATYAGAPKPDSSGASVNIPVKAPPAGIAIGGVILAIACTAGIFWVMKWLAREEVYGKLIAVVALGAAPAVVSALVGIVIVMIRTPDATPMEELIPSNLTALLGLKGGGAIASIGSSLGLFTLWSMALTIIGLSKALGRRMGEAAGLVLIPWGLFVLGKAVFAALLG